MNILYASVFLLSTCFALIYAKINLKRFNSFTVFVVISFIFNYIGFFYIALGVDTFRLEYIRFDYILLLHYIIVSIVLLILFYSYNNLSINSEFLVNVIRNKIFSCKSICIVFFILSATVYFGSVYLYIINVGIDNITLFSVLFNNGDATLSRSASSSSLGYFYLYQLGFNDFGLLTFGSLLLYKKFLKSTPSVYFANTFIFLFSLCLVVTFIFTGEKSKIIDFFIFYILILYFFGDLKLNFTSLLIFIALPFSLLFISYVIFMGSTGLNPLHDIISRVLGGQLQAGYHHVEYYFHIDELYYGTSFPNPFSIFPFTPVVYTQELMDWVVGPEFINGKKIVASMPTFFWGEILLNFGFVGVFLFPFFIGMFFRFIDNLFSFLPRNSLFILFYAWLIVHYKDLAFTGISNFVFDIKLYVVILFYIFVFILFYFLKKRVV